MFVPLERKIEISVMEKIYKIILKSSSYLYFSFNNQNLFKILKTLAQKCLNLSRLQIKNDGINVLKELNMPNHVLIILTETITSDKKLESDIITFLIKAHMEIGMKNLSIYFSDLIGRLYLLFLFSF